MTTAQKTVYALILFVLSVFCVEVAYAATQTLPDAPSIGNQICSIRWLFCGAVRATLCAITIMMVGFMVLAGRMTWGSAVIILCGMLLFANAEFFALMFTSNPRCFCAPLTIPVAPVIGTL